MKLSKPSILALIHVDAKAGHTLAGFMLRDLYASGLIGRDPFSGNLLLTHQGKKALILNLQRLQQLDAAKSQKQGS